MTTFSSLRPGQPKHGAPGSPHPRQRPQKSLCYMLAQLRAAAKPCPKGQDLGKYILQVLGHLVGIPTQPPNHPCHHPIDAVQPISGSPVWSFSALPIPPHKATWRGGDPGDTVRQQQDTASTFPGGAALGRKRLRLRPRLQAAASHLIGPSIRPSSPCTGSPPLWLAGSGVPGQKKVAGPLRCVLSVPCELLAFLPSPRPPPTG